MKGIKMPENTKSVSLVKKKEMFLRLQKEKGTKTEDRIVTQERKGKIPVSFIQQAYIDTIKNGHYDPDESRLPGPTLGYAIQQKLNIPALRKSIHEIVKRHEILRTNYSIVNGKSYQVINEVPDSILNIVDLHNLPQAEKEDEASRIILQRASDKFDIFNDSLMITFMVITSENDYKLVITAHHIATDGVSMLILQKELSILYLAFSNNMPSPLPELSIQYADFSIWQQNKYSNEYLTEKFTYWDKDFSNWTELKLPIARNYSSKTRPIGNTIPVDIESALSKQLMIFSSVNHISLFTTLFAAFISSVYCFSGYTYNVSTIPYNVRTQSNLEPLIGCFNDLQYVRVDLQEDPDLLEIIQRTNKKVLDVKDNYIPCSIYLKMPSFPHYSIPRIGFNLMQSPDRSLLNPDIRAAKITINTIEIPQPIITSFVFSMELTEHLGIIGGKMIYQVEQFDRAIIFNFINDYKHLLRNIINNPKMRISEVNIKPHKGLVS